MLNEDQLPPSPFHDGEVALQASVGVAERMEQFGRRAIREYMPDQHREFYHQLPFIVLGSVDGAGDAWVTLISGRPGFMTSPDAKVLKIETWLDPDDPATPGLNDDQAVGLLGIEFHTRRRNRMNGVVRHKGPQGFQVEVEHSFGNCPQYIQLRDYQFLRDPSVATPSPMPGTTDLSFENMRSLIESADTFFVSSYIEDERGRHVDASHRGGKPGFVRVNNDGSLTIPDFAGNLLFNTLGNFLVNPKAGLVFPSFETGNMLHLTGDVELVLDSEEIAAFQGAERIWTFRPRKLIFRQEALPLRFDTKDDYYSPNSLMTGDWVQVQSRIEAEKHKASWRPFKITRIVDESAVIRSLHLEPADGNGIQAHQAGQHLPIRVTPKDASAPIQRAYTISTAPSDGYYRLSVKRQGYVSQYLHDDLREGDIIEARAPAGAFTIDPFQARPAVLLATGVGITPIIAMLRNIVFEGLRTRRFRKTYIIAASRKMSERAFDDELTKLASQANGSVTIIRVLSDTDGMQPVSHYDAKGRIDHELLRTVLPFDAYDFYICGPNKFMQDLYDQLGEIGVPDNRIHAETFGPSSLQRQNSAMTPALLPVSAETVSVSFMKSGKEVRWMPETGSLLELAETYGLTPAYSCRSGSCGTCAVRVLSGKVTYAIVPSAPTAHDLALICCAVPAAAEGDQSFLELDL